MHRLASIDLGSNTLRLLIAEPTVSAPLSPIQVERRITRLGEHFLPSRTLQAAAMERSIVALREFVDLMGQRGVSEYLAGATAVVREASNGDQFLDMVRERTGLGVRLLSGSEEAQLSLLGVSSIIPSSETPMAIFDIGGGSTELIWKSPQEGSAVESLSTPVGVVHLTETFLREDPPDSNSCAELRQHVSGILARLTLPATLQNTLWVGTAGTVTTLASMHLGLREYDPGLINGTVLKRSWLLEVCNDLANMPIAERKKIPGLEPGREDIILAGALVTLELMDTFDFSEFTVSDAGLLEGLFLDLCQTLSAMPGEH
ncbi:MAG: Ppx/GppA phosphatase family protein [Syntrophobacterales bacterium]|jgi:exopolyphosphatase/guanosine-5'-triphosphate,3'-diphosphate pyrophosphatase